MKTLTTSDIWQMCSQYHLKLNGVFCRDEIPSKLHQGWYILNLDKSSGGGSHWTAWYYGKSYNLYFDSFGFEPPQELVNKIQPFKYNSKKIQNLNSDSCGWFSLYCIAYCERRGNDLNAFNSFLSLFTDKPENNEQILENYYMDQR